MTECPKCGDEMVKVIERTPWGDRATVGCRKDDLHMVDEFSLYPAHKQRFLLALADSVDEIVYMEGKVSRAPWKPHVHRGPCGHGDPGDTWAGVDHPEASYGDSNATANSNFMALARNLMATACAAAKGGGE